MSWVEIEKPGKSLTGDLAADAVISVSAKGHHAQRIILSLRRQNMTTPPAFFVRGARVSVRMGVGDNAGMLRIMPGGPHVVSCLGRSNNSSRTVSLSFLLQPSIKTGQQQKIAVECDYTDNWLEVTLPAWGQPAAKDTPKASEGAFQTAATVGNGVRPMAGGR